MPSQIGLKFFVVNNHLTNGVSFNLESCWSRSVSSVITVIRLSTQRVWHTFNYDVTVSNGVNLCCPDQAPFPIFWVGPGDEASHYPAVLRSLPKLPLGRALSHHKLEANCIYVNNAYTLATR